MMLLANLQGERFASGARHCSLATTNGQTSPTKSLSMAGSLLVQSPLTWARHTSASDSVLVHLNRRPILCNSSLFSVCDCIPLLKFFSLSISGNKLDP